MRNLKEKILSILNEDEESRNSDIRLTQMIWWRFHNNKLIELEDKKLAVRLSDLFDLPREDNIKRIRAKIQNEENKFLPTREDVRKQRKINEEQWRRYLGYNPELRTI